MLRKNSCCYPEHNRIIHLSSLDRELNFVIEKSDRELLEVFDIGDFFKVIDPSSDDGYNFEDLLSNGDHYPVNRPVGRRLIDYIVKSDRHLLAEIEVMISKIKDKKYLGPLKEIIDNQDEKIENDEFLQRIKEDIKEYINEHKIINKNIGFFAFKRAYRNL
jgi:hypothetical protein